jgi:hypothetical protein
MMYAWIWLRGLIASNVTFSIVLYVLLVLVVLVVGVVRLWRWRAQGRVLTRRSQLFWGGLLLVNVLGYIIGWPAFGSVARFSGLAWIISASRLYSLGVGSLLLIDFISGGISIVTLIVFILPQLKSHKKILPKKWGRVLIPGLFALAIVDLAIKVFIIGGFSLLTYRQTMWPAVEQASDLNKLLRSNDRLPATTAQLRQTYPDLVSLIGAYGRLCYFYQAEIDDYTLVTRVAGYDFVYNREHDRYWVREEDEIWQSVVRACQ